MENTHISMNKSTFVANAFFCSHLHSPPEPCSSHDFEKRRSWTLARWLTCFHIRVPECNLSYSRQMDKTHCHSCPLISIADCGTCTLPHRKITKHTEKFWLIYHYLSLSGEIIWDIYYSAPMWINFLWSPCSNVFLKHLY